MYLKVEEDKTVNDEQIDPSCLTSCMNITVEQYSVPTTRDTNLTLQLECYKCLIFVKLCRVRTVRLQHENANSEDWPQDH